MTTTRYTPAGFCHSCHDAMEPSTSADCGRDVSATRPAKSGRTLPWCRQIGQTSALLLMLAVLGGGSDDDLQPRHRLRECSTDYLLSLDWKNNVLINRELEQRLLSSKFSQAQVVAYSREFAIARPTSIRTPRPAGSAGCVEFQFFFPCDTFICGGNDVAKLFYQEYISEELWVDGILRHADSSRHTRVAALERILPQLEPGIHVVEVREQMLMRLFPLFVGSPDSQLYTPDIPHLPCTVEVSSSQTIVIEDKPVEAFVVGKVDEFLEHVGSDGWFVEIGLPFWDSGSFLRGHGFPKLAGRLEFYSPDGTTSAYVLIPDNNCEIGERIPEELKCGEPVFARFIPSARLAFDAGLSEYLNAVVEWSDVTFDGVTPVFGDPDVIRPFDPTEFAATLTTTNKRVEPTLP